MKLFIFSFVLFVLVFLIHPMTQAASPWPASSGTDFSDALCATKSTLEPSGMVWNAVRDEFLIVGDEGEICTLSSDGFTATCTKPDSYDLEGITIADDTSNVAYAGVELVYRSSTDYDIFILEYNLDTQSYTGKSWNLSAWMPVSSSLGMEALTFVPNSAHPYTDSTSGGVFYAGSQYNGQIYVFDVDLATSGSVAFVDTILVDSDYTDLADLYYSSDTELVYAVYDGNNRLVELDDTGTIVNKYELPGSDQEAFSLVADCTTGTATAYVGQDAGSSVGPVINKYTNYPVTCVATSSAPVTPVDADADGVSADTDCNDSDASISVNQTFYADADGDGLGNPASTTSECSSTAPAGYVSNSSDTNDSGTTTTSTIEIYGNAVDDDGDGKIDEYNTVSENGYHPTYSGYDPSSSSTYKSTVKSISGTTNGDILVKYADDSIYQYDIYTMTTSKTAKVYSWYSTGYLYAFNPNSSWKYVWINAYTGAIY